MTDRGTADTRALAAEAWRRLFDFIIATSAQRNRLLGERGLTPNDARALFSLQPGEGRSMRSLADEWRCDASNATWIVDRLERQGLAERRALPDDRRVKLVVLTRAGETTRRKLMAEVYRPPPEMLALDRTELEAIVQGLARLPTGGDPTASSRVRRPPASSNMARSKGGRMKRRAGRR